MELATVGLYCCRTVATTVAVKKYTKTKKIQRNQDKYIVKSDVGNRATVKCILKLLQRNRSEKKVKKKPLLLLPSLPDFSEKLWEMLETGESGNF